jgi:hypothetical protein
MLAAALDFVRFVGEVRGGAACGVSVKRKPGLRRSVPAAGRAGSRITEHRGRNETCQVFSTFSLQIAIVFEVGKLYSKRSTVEPEGWKSSKMVIFDFAV